MKDDTPAKPLVINGIADIQNHTGKLVGPGEWLQVTQQVIDNFAAATLDFQWVHTDVERAKTSLPGGKTMAHGYLTLSLIPQFLYALISIENINSFINYGIHEARFITPVQEGSRIRLKAILTKVESQPNGSAKIFLDCTVELEGAAKPACVAELISLVM